ncbi:MAG: hypothetical protein DSY76_00240 [Bacteroidetes bacterium]|nr:MAG: hypothetical protein DSY76_00240 [Bacteroidota bacterium]
MKFKRIILITLAILGVLIIVILAFGPMIAVNQLQKNSKEWVGRKLEIGGFSLNYFTGTVKVNHFTMYESDDKTTFIAFDSLIIDTEPYHLFSNELVVEELGLVGLRTYITQHDSVFNFDDLIVFYSQNSDSIVGDEELSDTAQKTEPMVIKVSNIHLNAKEISYTAMLLQHETKMVNLNLVVPYISWNADGGSRAGVQFDLAENGHFGIDLDYNPDSNDFEADVRINNLDLASYYVFVERELNISSLKGMFSTHLLISGNANEIEKTILSGTLNLHDFEVQGENQHKLIALERLNIGLGKIDNFNKRFIIDSVHLIHPFVDFELLDKGTNFDNIVKEDSTQTKPEVEEVEDTLLEPNVPLYYAIHKFKIDDGQIEFEDHTTPRLFSYHLSAINMLSQEITSDADWVKTHLDMLLNNRGKMKVEFGFNPMKPKDMDIDYVMTNFQLSDINVYSEMSTGYPFVYGDMYYYSQTSIRDGQIKSENKLRINDVELGEKVEGWKSIPLKLALFLLKDKNGDVVMDIPVRGDLNDPEVNIKKLAWTTLKKAIIKVASSPVDYLAGFAKIDPNDIKRIDFAYGDTSLTSGIEHQLDMLIKLEKSKPGLNIQMAYFNDIDKEKEAIASNEIGKLFYQEHELDYLNNEEEFLAFIKSKTLKDSVNIPKDCISLFGYHKADSLYHVYSQMREDKIMGYLKLKNDSTQISIQPYNASSPKNIGSNPMFEMKYSVEDE